MPEESDHPNRRIKRQYVAVPQEGIMERAEEEEPAHPPHMKLDTI